MPVDQQKTYIQEIKGLFERYRGISIAVSPDSADQGFKTGFFAGPSHIGKSVTKKSEHPYSTAFRPAKNENQRGQIAVSIGNDQ